MSVEIRLSEIHGMGVFAIEDFEEGDWETIYGTPRPEETVYCFEEEEGFWEPFPPFRYLNHSADPNCFVEWDEDNGMTYLIAIREIEIGEELTIDYGYDPIPEAHLC